MKPPVAFDRSLIAPCGMNCGLPNRDKVFWVIALFIFKGVAVVSFILYKDYLLTYAIRSKAKIF